MKYYSLARLYIIVLAVNLFLSLNIFFVEIGARSKKPFDCKSFVRVLRAREELRTEMIKI